MNRSATATYFATPEYKRDNAIRESILFDDSVEQYYQYETQVMAISNPIIFDLNSLKGTSQQLLQIREKDSYVTTMNSLRINGLRYIGLDNIDAEPDVLIGLGRLFTRSATPVETINALCTAYPWLSSVLELDKKSRFGKSLEVLFKYMNELLVQRAFDVLDDILYRFPPSQASANLLTGMLAITLSAKDKIEHRAEFFRKVQDHLRCIGELEQGLLDGLD